MSSPNVFALSSAISHISNLVTYNLWVCYSDLGVSLGLYELQNVANEFILQNLKHLSSDKFVEIPADKLTQLLCDDNLQVDSEFDLCQKVIIITCIAW